MKFLMLVFIETCAVSRLEPNSSLHMQIEGWPYKQFVGMKVCFMLIMPIGSIAQVHHDSTYYSSTGSLSFWESVKVSVNQEAGRYHL